MVECLRRRSASIDGDMMAKVERKSQKESLSGTPYTWNEMFCLDDDGAMFAVTLKFEL